MAVKLHPRPEVHLTPADVRKVACPKCGVDADQPCVGPRAPTCHRDRVRAARQIPCRKTVYASAKYAREIAVKQSKRAGAKIEAYRCRQCHGWHTGHPIRKDAA